MQVQYTIGMAEIEHCPELSRYNYIVWKFLDNKGARIGCTHFIEIYDDISSFPIYKFGTFEEQPIGKCEFTQTAMGEGDAIEPDEVGHASLSVTVDMF